MVSRCLHLYNSTVALDQVSLSLVLSVSMLKRSRAPRAVILHQLAKLLLWLPLSAYIKLYDPNTNNYAFFSRNQWNVSSGHLSITNEYTDIIVPSVFMGITEGYINKYSHWYYSDSLPIILCSSCLSKLIFFGILN